MIGELVPEAVAGLRRAVDVLLDLELSALASVEVAGLLRDVEVQRRRLVAVDHRVLAEVDQRGVAGEFGRCSPADLLVDMLRVAPAQAKARVAQARDLTPQVLPCGEIVEPVLPRTADAARAGEISPAHVTVIARALDRIPNAIAYEAAPVAEAMLVEAARHQHPGALAQTAAMLLARLDPDGLEPSEDELQRRREFSLPRRADGSARARGDWTPQLAAVWQAILDSLAAPQPAADGMPDDRSPGQRRHDAMLEAGLRLLRSDTLPAAGGTPVTVLLRVDADPPAADPPAADPADAGTGGDAPAGGMAKGSGGGVARAGTGEIWPLTRLRANLGDVAVVPIVIDHHGAALRCGRTQRFATRAQRLALAARDGGCVFPGCARPAAWCEVHHVLEWALGGLTDIDNMCLLCAYHHREFERRGWVVYLRDGVPEWLPPPFIDPGRRPIRNTTHHPPDLTFGRAG